MNSVLSIDDLSEDLEQILQWAITMKSDEEIAVDFFPLMNMSVGSIYEKPSTRTRVSFEVGINKLGGNSLTLLKGDIQLGKSETIADTARVLSRYLDAITYRCYSHLDVAELANNSNVPVINALSDKHHPCQAAADLMTIIEKKGMEEIKIAWVGDGNNVCNSYIEAASIFDFEISIFCPKGCEPHKPLLNKAKDFITLASSKSEALEKAQIVTTDVWTSMSDESSSKERKKTFKNFFVEEKDMELADDKAIFLHCLPAHRGEEISFTMLEHTQSMVWDQAENRLHVQQSLLEFLLAD